MILREAIIAVLARSGKLLTDQELTAELARRKLYLRQDGTAADLKQIRNALSSRIALFVRYKGKVELNPAINRPGQLQF